MNCYSCDAAPVNVCKRCARPYCEDHGNAQYCADCLKPASALPSFNLYRGSLLAMLVGTALAVVLIVRPPGETKGAAPVIVGRSSPTATASSGTPQPTVPAETPQATASAQGGATAAAGSTTPESGTPSPAATAGAGATPAATQSPFIEYVVQSGDSVASIAQKYLAPGDSIVAFQNAIINLNGLSGTNPVLHPGQKLLLPRSAP
ncbi:MAG: LysM peptidoglycan-binding domain-containing protein [Chloroflexota bacterium]|nr:LysM peptidoglycan-binding domain-containing protein [Chloroflexota bacterium]